MYLAIPREKFLGLFRFLGTGAENTLAFRLNMRVVQAVV